MAPAEPAPSPSPSTSTSPTPAELLPDGGSEPGAWSKDAVAAARRECIALLRGLDIDYAPLEPIGEPGGCGAPAPVSVTRVAGVAMTPAATLTCDMAAALHGWVSASVDPAAR